VLWVSACAAVIGCAPYEPVPRDFVGPTATISDWGFSAPGVKSQLFAVVSIDGQRVHNAFQDSALENRSRALSYVPNYPRRRVPLRRVKVGLRASHTTEMPIQAVPSQIAGTFFRVEGEVESTPKELTFYVVKGELAKEQSCVWIEEENTRERVTKKACTK
jgi:hypothetical protein